MDIALATTRGKEFALYALGERRMESVQAKRIDNSELPAGSSMYFYCISCGGISDVLPENYISIPRKICAECQALKDLGWLE